MRDFIPLFHTDYTPKEKLSDEWFLEAVNYYYGNGTLVQNLVHDKKLQEIEEYASGDINMEPFRELLKNKKSRKPNRIDFEPLPLLPVKLNSAHSIIQKIPLEVEVKANDALALEKKDSDTNFLKYKPEVEKELSQLTETLGLGPIKLGSTMYSAVPYSDSPYGLDLTDPEDESVFKNLIYSLSVEAAFETSLQSFWDNTRFDDFKSELIKDQIYFGVSAGSSFISSITGLPQYLYLHPSQVEVPVSRYKDYKDRSCTFISEDISPEELFNRFGDEIVCKETLDNILNQPKVGYCDCNGINPISLAQYGKCNLQLVQVEIKSIDFFGVKKLNNNKKSRFTRVVVGEEAKACKEKRFVQNTYKAYWLRNTPYFFGKTRLDFAYREKGRESYQSFSSFIYRSQKKSIVELGIYENKKAQIASLKAMEILVKASPPGKYIDLKYVLGAFQALSKNKDSAYTLNHLLDLALNKNTVIGDSTNLENPNAGNFRPFEKISGGLKEEIVGYLQTILDAEAKISRYTGINEQLTGQSANPQGLIGLQKLLINSSINALYPIHQAMDYQLQHCMNLWAYAIIDAVKSGGARKEAIKKLIGTSKTEIIKGVDDLPLHNFSAKINTIQREEERQRFEIELERLKQQGVLNAGDDYILSALSNPKDKRGFLAVRFKKWQQKQDAIRQEQSQERQALIAQQGENKQAEIATKGEVDVKKIGAQAQASAELIKLAAQLGMSDKQLDAAIKKDLQQDRGGMQLDKSIRTLEAKSDLENEKGATIQ